MGEQKERMRRGELYLADENDLVRERTRARELCTEFNRSRPDDHASRDGVLHELFERIGDGSEVIAPFLCDYGTYIRMGARCFVNYGAIMLDGASITIGDDVQLGPRVQLLTATHPLDAALRRARWESTRPVTIGNNVWLGAGVIVCPGVTIGDDTVVGAGTVVVRDLPAGVLAVGNPARVVRTL
jgi:maltose O-acetyltransferase